MSENLKKDFREVLYTLEKTGICAIMQMRDFSSENELGELKLENLQNVYHKIKDLNYAIDLLYRDIKAHDSSLNTLQIKG